VEPESASSVVGMKNDIVFRGATRPPMFIGVPIVPLFLVCGVILLVSIYFSLKYAFAIIPAVVIMQGMVKVDDHIFDLLGLRLLTALRTAANPRSKSGDRLVGPNALRRQNWL
jgi:type IV secretion system protein VirB3